MKNELDRSVYIYCGEIINRNILERKEKIVNKKKQIYWDYPAMASVCCANNRRPLFKDYSKGVRENGLHLLLKTGLLKLGKIGGKNKNCKYIIGRCAEQHAANKLLKKISCKLIDINFSVAMRPRTREKFPPCYNCKQTFPNL